MAEDQVMAEVVAEDQVMAEVAATAEVAVAATAETPEMIEAVGKKTEGMMVKIAMADAVDGNITKLKNKNRVC